MSDENVYEMKSSKPFNYRKYFKTGISLLFIILLLVTLLNSIMITKEGEYRVVRQFGEVVRIESEPGLHFKVPFIQTATVLPNKYLVYDMEEQEINTLDKKRIIIDNYAVWHITDPSKMINNAKTVVNAQARMGEFIFSTVRSELGQMNYEEIINDEKSQRGNLNSRITDQVNELLSEYGAQVQDVRVKRTDLPEDNEQSVYTRMISERESKAQEYLSKGEAEKNRIIAAADREVKEMLSKAKADAEQIRAEGEQEAAQIYNEAFKKDAEFYRLYRTLESYKSTVNDKTTIILPHDSPYARALLGYFEIEE
ncbi:protease modulator HflC [Salinibacillus xinjiangensis]|uniref:Protein HflC n=1 Tax=Salinibacillus xinjiangensis TaxID=1229268 RepID=A0A6G1X9Q3_9BACI|nr:protease modulator HflC [Salinibacillus xinjiangensis]MRG87672.1 protease modulator HflC [Salinibacillus xinjiangensis]